MPVYAEFKPAFQATNPLEYANRVQQQSVNAFQRAQHLRLQEEQNQRAYRQLELQEQQLDLQKKEADRREESRALKYRVDSRNLDKQIAEEKALEEYFETWDKKASDLLRSIQGGSIALQADGTELTEKGRGWLRRHDMMINDLNAEGGVLASNPLYASKVMQRLASLNDTMRPHMNNIQHTDRSDWIEFTNKLGGVRSLPLEDQEEAIEAIRAEYPELMLHEQYGPAMEKSITQAHSTRQNKISAQVEAAKTRFDQTIEAQKTAVEVAKTASEIGDNDLEKQRKELDLKLKQLEIDAKQADKEKAERAKKEFRIQGASDQRQFENLIEDLEFLKEKIGTNKDDGSYDVGGFHNRPIQGIQNFFAGKGREDRVARELTTDEWLKKVSQLKGALTEKEGERLDKGVINFSNEPDEWNRYLQQLIDEMNTIKAEKEATGLWYTSGDGPEQTDSTDPETADDLINRRSGKDIPTYNTPNINIPPTPKRNIIYNP